MSFPAFRHGDLVKVIHAFDHEHRPDSDADALLTGDLYAYICEISRMTDDDRQPSYKIAWHGAGRTARKLGGALCVETHKPGYTSAWWSECCLALVKGRPNP